MKNSIILISILGIILVSCTEKDKNNKQDITEPKDTLTEKKVPKIVSLVSPLSSSSYAINDTVNFKFDIKDTKFLDSIVLYINGERKSVIKDKSLSLKYFNNKIKPGRHKFKFICYLNNKENENKYIYLNYKSDIIPKIYGYKKIKQYDHHTSSYTQGFVYEDGYIYEGTGQYGESSLLKYNLKTHEIIKSFNLPSNIFGEGIVVIDDKIIQLTWHAGMGFIYDKKSFKQLSKFNLETEGWGLTYNGDKLIMSDGSHKLHYLETSVYSKSGSMEVYDNNGKVTNLNELEYIDNKIYANIYQANKIAIIQEESGKVEAYIDLSGIFQNRNEYPNADVLNGIAKKGNNLLITGKYWPHIYEIELVKK